ncbi:MULTISPECIES: KilA-N domain-containing protein [Synechococcales]|uniref:KilA-N domain-containing protein n=1 Tax=Synechococcales TaxID=1890424 RepID=UPI000B98EE86|nr:MULTISPECIES: KilA-N domain-containing protein [Synechococcales]MCP9942452.1 KilA-N domain-containing protein [Cyanobium sp. ATX 6E8]
MKTHTLVSRSWNGTPIARRSTDGYVNATAMCKANGKRWKDYRESDRCQLYLDALESVAGISVHALVESRSGGAGGGGTWVHPQVAVDLARWISAPFAVWMDGWFLESLQQAQPAPVMTPPPRLREAEVIALVEQSVALFEKLGGLDQRDELLFKDIVRSSVLTASSGGVPAINADDELTLGDAWLEVFQQVLPRTKFCSAGKLVAQAYRQEFGKEPPCRQQFVDGAPRQVKSYRRSWLLDTLKGFKAQLAGS